MFLKEISSLQNPLIKEVLALKSKSRFRKKSNRFVIEGIRELTLAREAAYTIETILFDETIFSLEQLSSFSKSITVIKISTEVYKKVAYRETTEGVLAIAKTKEHELHDLKFNSKHPLILVAEAPEKPGNIGALLRTADAANLDAVIIANPKTDLYNPNIIRSSVGCVFTNTVVTGATEEIISFLKEHQIHIFCAALTASTPYHECDYKIASALVVGTEATGLSNTWLKNSYANIIIPMQGTIDSMNVSVSAAILIFEAKRQRNFN